MTSSRRNFYAAILRGRPYRSMRDIIKPAAKSKKLTLSEKSLANFLSRILYSTMAELSALSTPAPPQAHIHWRRIMESIKCPQCGLVNFATAPECKRCQLSFESERASSDSPYDDSWDQNAQNHYWPQGAPEQQTKQRVFSGGVVFLAVILGLATALFLMQHAFHPFDPDTAKGLGGVLGLTGVLLLFVTH